MYLPRDILFRKGKRVQRRCKTAEKPTFLVLRLPNGCNLGQPFEDWSEVLTILEDANLWATREGDNLVFHPIGLDQGALFLGGDQ